MDLTIVAEDWWWSWLADDTTIWYWSCYWSILIGNIDLFFQSSILKNIFSWYWKKSFSILLIRIDQDWFFSISDPQGVQRWLDGERAAPPAVLPLDDLPVAPLLDLENVAQALQSFPADTAPGPSGLRVQHLRDALQNGGGSCHPRSSCLGWPSRWITWLGGREDWFPERLQNHQQRGSPWWGAWALPSTCPLGDVVLPEPEQFAVWWCNLAEQHWCAAGRPFGPTPVQCWSRALGRWPEARLSRLLHLLLGWWPSGRVSCWCQRCPHQAPASCRSFGVGCQLVQERSHCGWHDTSPADVATKLPPALVQSADGSSHILTDFEFLGAAIGRPAHLQAHAAARVAGARQLLEAVGALPNPQVALRLLRASAGYARLVHTMRCCPPAGTRLRCRLLMSWSKNRLVRWAAFTWNPLSGSRPHMVLLRRGYSSALHKHTPLPLIRLRLVASLNNARPLDAGYWVANRVMLPELCLSWMLTSALPATLLLQVLWLCLNASSVSALMRPAGDRSLTPLHQWIKQLSSPKPHLGLGHSSLAFLLDAPRWSLLSSMQSCGRASGCLNLALTPWCPKCDAILDTYMAITLRCAWRGGESPLAQCLAWPSLFLVWARVPPPRTRKSWLAVAPAAGWREKCPPQACWCLPPSFPQLISPLRRPSGWMSWARRVGPRLPRCTRTTRRGTSTLLQLARLNTLSFSRWWPRLLAPGRLKRPRLLTISAVLPAMEALCFRRPVCSFALGGPVRLCAGELSWETS